MLNRRSFLKNSSLFAATSFLLPGTAMSEQSKQVPWMYTAGKKDTPYGMPSLFEDHVKRSLSDPFPGSPFSISQTPIQYQRGSITPNGLHFGVHHNGIADIDPARHELIIHGLVEKPLRFSIESLLRYPMVSRVHFLECGANTAANAIVPNEAAPLSCQDLYGQLSGAEWTGVPLKLLLEETGLRHGAKWVIAEGADSGNHARSIPLSKILDDAIVALYQNGERLRPAQGYPIRLFLPGWEGNTSVKWLHRLEVVDAPIFTKDESGLYTEPLREGGIEYFSFQMDVKSVITQPSAGQILSGKGFCEISGLAWSGFGKVHKVEVSVDGGRRWTEAKLQGPVQSKSLTRFSLPWEWSGKETTLLSRATDEFGRTQPTRNEWKKRYADFSIGHYNAVQAWRIASSGEVHNDYV